jgi:hypothetical protein
LGGWILAALLGYITGISCKGLRCAASLAERLGRGDEARLWRASADRLQQAWLKHIQWDEDRTYISGLWPTWVAAKDRDAYRTHLERRSDPKRYLPWTCFVAAMTHQWLLLAACRTLGEDFLK